MLQAKITMMNDTSRIKRTPLLAYGGCAAIVYLACVILTGRAYATNVGSQISMGLICGALLFIPLFLGLLSIQIVLKWLSNKYLPESGKQVFVLIVSAMVLLIGSCVYSFGIMSARKNKHAFDRFFSSKPSSAELLTFGYERTIFGDGSYVLIFKVGQNDLRTFLEHEGYVHVGVETDPDHWRLSLCNHVVRILTRNNLEIGSDVACFSKEGKTNRSRVFYSEKQNLAIFVGFGKYPNP